VGLGAEEAEQPGPAQPLDQLGPADPHPHAAHHVGQPDLVGAAEAGVTEPLGPHQRQRPGRHRRRHRRCRRRLGRWCGGHVWGVPGELGGCVCGRGDRRDRPAQLLEELRERDAGADLVDRGRPLRQRPHVVQPPHRAGDLVDEVVDQRRRLVEAAGVVGRHRRRERRPQACREAVQVGPELGLDRPHQAGVKRRADPEWDDREVGQRRGQRRPGGGHGLGGAADHGLGRRVVVRHLGAGSLGHPEGVGTLDVVQDQRRHRAPPLRHRSLHERAPDPGEPHGVGEGQRAGRDQRAVLAQAVPSEPDPLQAELHDEGPVGGDLHREDAGLGELGQVQARVRSKQIAVRSAPAASHASSNVSLATADRS